MPQANKSWIALGGILIGAVAALILSYGRMQAAEKRASVAEGRALAAIESDVQHKRAADDALNLAKAKDSELESQRNATEHWRAEAERWRVPPAPPKPPANSAIAVTELRAVGLSSVQEAPIGVALNLTDAGLVNLWGIERPILLNKQIAQSALIEGLDLQVGTLTTQKALLTTATQELQAGNKDLRVAAEQFKAAYADTGKALTIERRLGKVKIGAAVVVTYFIARGLK
jgi:hypothetical protein